MAWASPLPCYLVQHSFPPQPCSLQLVFRQLGVGEGRERSPPPSSPSPEPAQWAWSARWGALLPSSSPSPLFACLASAGRSHGPMWTYVAICWLRNCGVGGGREWSPSLFRPPACWGESGMGPCGRGLFSTTPGSRHDRELWLLSATPSSSRVARGKRECNLTPCGPGLKPAKWGACMVWDSVLPHPSPDHLIAADRSCGLDLSGCLSHWKLGAEGGETEPPTMQVPQL